MPQNTPSIKVDAVRGFGGEVLLHGANFDEAKTKAIELSKEKNMTFIPPFDHPLVIAGQGTLAMEMLQQVADLDYVFVQVGGGGLAAGVAILLKQFMPEIKIIGVDFVKMVRYFGSFDIVINHCNTFFSFRIIVNRITEIGACI